MSCCSVSLSLNSYQFVVLLFCILIKLYFLLFFKVKQLRNRADEDARLVHMSLQMDSELPSSLRKDLDHLMILVSVFCKHIHTYTFQHHQHHLLHFKNLTDVIESRGTEQEENNILFFSSKSKQ